MLVVTQYQEMKKRLLQYYACIKITRYFTLLYVSREAFHVHALIWAKVGVSCKDHLSLNVNKIEKSLYIFR